MPTALRIGPYRFYFYSYDCGEPRHIHVDREQHGYGRRELRDIERITRENLEQLRNEWDIFCNDTTRST